jgi:DNA-binding Lrp family transcriptional regulator
MDDWWDEIDSAVMSCLRSRGPMAPSEIGRALGMSEAAAASVVTALAKQGKVRICLVQASPTHVDQAQMSEGPRAAA